ITKPRSMLFMFPDSVPPEVYTLSLHDALPIWPRGGARCRGTDGAAMTSRSGRPGAEAAAPSDESSDVGLDGGGEPPVPDRLGDRSEEHTSELQSRGQLVCRLLLEKNKSWSRAV